MSNHRHKAILEVDLSALKNNLHIFKNYLAPTTKVMVMVKANAYGGGNIEIARFLDANNPNGYLGVAYADEGMDIRIAGINSPMMVMNVQEDDFENLIKYHLEPEIYSISILEKIVNFTNKNKIVIPIHLKLETGMNRLGFVKNDLKKAISLLTVSPYIEIKSILTHLVASPDPEHDNYTVSQITKFEDMYHFIEQQLGIRPMRHVLNSGGVVRFSKYQFDMVRVGIGIYGIDVSKEIQPTLEPVNQFKGVISQIKTVKKGETIGYSRKGIAKRDLKVAVLNFGYGDGFLRKAGNGNYAVLINGKKAPTIGNICMDMTMVDITGIPKVKEGDIVEIFGKNLPVQELAICYDTIPYEVFTGITARVRRVYVK